VFILYFKTEAHERFPSSHQHWGQAQGPNATHQESVGLMGKKQKQGREHQLFMLKPDYHFKDKAMYNTLLNLPPRYAVFLAISCSTVA